MQEETLDSIFNDVAVVCSKEVEPEVKASFTGILIIPSEDICLADLRCPQLYKEDTVGRKPATHWKKLEKNIIRYNIKRYLSVFPGIKVVGDAYNYKYVRALLETHKFLNINNNNELSAWTFRFDVTKCWYSDCLILYNHMRNCFGSKAILVIYHDTGEKYEFYKIEMKHQMFTYWNVYKLNKRIKRENHPLKSRELREYFNSVHELQKAINRNEAI